MEPLSDKAHAELLLLYEMCLGDIERGKRWIWDATYQTIIAQAGLYALHAAFSKQLPGYWSAIMFSLILLALLILSGKQIVDSHRLIYRSRERVKRSIFRFQKPFQEVFSLDKPIEENNNNIWLTRPSILPGLLIVLFSTIFFGILLWISAFYPMVNTSAK